ncbi:FtsK/SpoIIIE family protein [Natribacillus halophilus]|uniref:FtsK/SpoIIIE family protein n=2 Tax=Natribacillus halophilus TaxID=549003 RepID=A0A1G8PY89_9BACI|nr:FtsK/SpoIIIE domain-containing protein [Natribacillus halophilus]SDI97441.1 FtsK/SpoIIIE family protein [Natribacillus halophilus]
MRHAVLRTGLLLFGLFFFLTLGIYFRDPIMHGRPWLELSTYQAIRDWDWLNISVGFFLAIVVGILAVGLSYVIFYDGYKRLSHKQKLARMFISNGMMETANMDKKIPWNHRKKQKTKVTYFPKAYYRVKDNYIHIKIAMDMTKHQKQYLNLGEDIENGFYADTGERELEDGYISYRFLYDVRRNRISINDVKAENGSLKLMKHIEWAYDSLPHMLIAGGTGGGKTYFILTMIDSLIKSGAVVYILDPKRSDLADLADVMPKGTVLYTPSAMMKVLRESVDAMMKRSEEMKKMPNYQTGGNYADVGLPPVFIVFDEYVAFMESLDRMEQMKALEYMKQVIMLGRQMGYFLILAAQRPDAKYLADGIRDQFNFRVALGRMSEAGYGMMFGDTDKRFIFKNIKGRGYADTGTSVISEFYTPLVPKEYDFLKEIGTSAPGMERALAAVAASGSDRERNEGAPGGA